VKARVEFRGTHVLCVSEQPNVEARRGLTDEAIGRWRTWAARYNKAMTTNVPSDLPSIGREIFGWLDGDDRWLEQSLAGVGTIYFEIATRAAPDGVERAFLDVPWELLAGPQGYLATDSLRQFCVWRRMGAVVTPFDPIHDDFGLLFMAAAPEGVGELDYEAEEAAILNATNPQYVRVMVEESGSLPLLRDRALQEEAFEAVHLSCHGEVGKEGAFLALESSEGKLELATAANLVKALGEKKPPLLFLSACRTAEQVDAATPLTQDLIRAGVPNVLGWDGSVYDSDAMLFAKEFYVAVSHHETVVHAAAAARQKMLSAHLADQAQCRHWHLARVYSGPEGGGPLCKKGRSKRVYQTNIGYREFLDKEQQRVPVASRSEFVGRRREIQRILRAFAEGDHTGVLVHGMGHLGKSSLAARVANRMTHHRTVVIYSDYSALTIFDTVANALPINERLSLVNTWRPQVAGDVKALYDAMRAMLEGPFAREIAQPRSTPILLIIDDFEQVLEDPRPGENRVRVKVEYIPTIQAVLSAFRDSGALTESQFLVTSRYTFAVNDRNGKDLTSGLLDVQLRPMSPRERDKQLAAAARNLDFTGPEDAAEAEDVGALTERAKTAAHGNPGLQTILTKPILASDLKAAEAAIAAIERYLQTGDAPKGTKAADFFSRVSFDVFKSALTPAETSQMRAAHVRSADSTSYP
jgi:hypothetical protein